jgi:hypothetical protein
MRVHVKAFARRINIFVAHKSDIHLVFIIREPSMRIDVVVSTLQVGCYTTISQHFAATLQPCKPQMTKQFIHTSVESAKFVAIPQVLDKWDMGLRYHRSERSTRCRTKGNPSRILARCLASISSLDRLCAELANAAP